MVKLVQKVLFLCCGNTCRSIMAEALVRHFRGNALKACSAGLDPMGYISPNTLKALGEAGISTDGLCSKGLSEVPLKDLGYIVNLTQFKVERLIPSSFSGEVISWPVPDPFAQDIESFRQVRDQLEWFVRRKLPGIIGAVNSEQ